jgi:hypothetical protein
MELLSIPNDYVVSNVSTRKVGVADSPRNFGNLLLDCMILSRFVVVANSNRVLIGWLDLLITSLQLLVITINYNNS